MSTIRPLPTLLVLLLVLSAGCASSQARWVCEGSSCAPREDAMTQCQAKANAYFISSNDPGFIDQCMRGSGFQRVACGNADQHADCR
jgi:hypothetical protein